MNIDIDGMEITAHLDTGGPFAFAVPYAMKDTLELESEPVELGRAGMVGASFKIWKANLSGKIKVGGVVFDAPEITLEERSGDFITIGYEALKHLSITIDQKNRLLKTHRELILEKLI